MSVLRIVADLKARNPEQLATFYKQLLDLDGMMGLGRVNTSSARLPGSSGQSGQNQVSFVRDPKRIFLNSFTREATS